MDKFEFEKWIERILKIMKGCESYIGMTLAEAIEKQIPKAPVGGILRIMALPCLWMLGYCVILR